MSNNNDNAKKAIAGYNTKDALINLLNTMKENSQIKDITKDFSIGYPNMDEHQFKVDALITFNDESKWIIHTSSSYRSDRARGTFFIMEQIKNIVPNIEKAYLVFPDTMNEKDSNTLTSHSNKIRNGLLFSPVNDLLTFRQLEYIIQAKSNYKNNVGQVSAKKGIDFEEKINSILNNENNKKKWNDHRDNTIIGDSFDWFFYMLKSVGISTKEKIKDIKATTKIEKLPSGGQPKTDVACIINTNIKTYELYISCKNSEKKSVSIHQYSAIDYISVLGIDDTDLQKALLEFQKYGGKKALEKNSPSYSLTLEQNMYKYNSSLIKWAYFGIGGEGTGPQIANTLVSFNQKTLNFSVYNINEFIQSQLILKKTFGTPFSWTYASGQKGKSIQLKGFIN